VTPLGRRLAKLEEDDAVRPDKAVQEMEMLCAFRLAEVHAAAARAQKDAFYALNPQLRAADVRHIDTSKQASKQASKKTKTKNTRLQSLLSNRSCAHPTHEAHARARVFVARAQKDAFYALSLQLCAPDTT